MACPLHICSKICEGGLNGHGEYQNFEKENKYWNLEFGILLFVTFMPNVANS